MCNVKPRSRGCTGAVYHSLGLYWGLAGSLLKHVHIASSRSSQQKNAAVLVAYSSAQNMHRVVCVAWVVVLAIRPAAQQPAYQDSRRSRAFPRRRLSSALPMGREFATAFMQNLNGDSDGRFTIEVSAALSAQGSTKVKVSAVGQVFEKDVDPGKGVSFRLPVSVEMQGSGRFDKTVVVEASQDVNVLSFNYKQDTADTSVVYPLQEWGTEYYIFTPPSYYWGTYKEFSITNHKEHNLAEVRLRAGVVFQGNYYPAGSKISITLKPFESVQIQSEADLSGTKVVSKLPVAVSSGHSCAQKYTGCNHVYEQLLPTRSWGKEFIIAPLPFHDSPNKHDSVYLQAFQSTKVSMNIAGNVQGFSLYAGQTIELFSQWPNSIYLTSNKGIQVLFEFNGGPTDVKQYFDPFLMSILPTSHFSKSYSLEGQQDFTNSVILEGTCWAMGDPHYRTFDGYYFNFMGNCTYTMAKNCHIDTSHPAFEVDAQNMYGTLWNLPITMDNGKVKLSQSGMSVLVETDFGLVVQYDWEQYLTISVSGDFAGKVCGLCGNFNGKHDDDLFTPSGELAGSVQALGKSWRIPGMAEDAYCRDQCVGQCTNCKSDSLMESVTDRLFCGFLSQVMEGPFSACSAIIAPKVYHDNCMYDVCMGEGKWNFFCNTLQVYSDACQRAGIKIHDWRHIAHCPHPACPENSHYEFCGIACPATCETPDAPSKCKASCVETCVCDDGFLLSGTKCVPKTECGCTYMGHYVVAGASIWVDDQCMQNCFCNGAKRQMECKKTGCQAGYECKVVEGLIGCHPMTYATCRASGDPHYRSFDGHVYTFQGTCVYQMAGVCSKTATLPGSPVLEPFDVLVQNNGHNKRAGSSTKLVEVKVYENSIVLSKDHIRSVLINSELTNLPVTLNQGNVTVKLISNFAEIETAFGLTVYYDWKTAVLVKIPSSYAGAMCGLCGNYNQDSKDDLVMKNGKQAASAEEMGKSWRVAETPGCVDGCNDTNHCPDCDFTQIGKFESNAFCGLIRDPKGPFRKCHAVVPPGDDFKNCVDDVCNNNGNLHSFCDSLHLYTIACQQAGVEVDQWRNGNFCPKSDFKHPNNSHYEHCASVCHVTCGISSSTGCKKPCQEGWVQCYEFSCGPHEKCEVKNGIRLCQPVGKGVCSISGDPHYNTFDKGTYDFQGTCTYTAAEACHLSGTRLPAFSVAVENEKWYAMTSDPKVSVAKLLSVTVYGNTLILRKNQIGMIMLNGIMTTIPLNINDNQVQVYQEGTYYVILTDFGLRVTYDMVYHITVTVPGNYRGHTCGLCGNFNDNKADEFQLPDGKETKDVLSFGAAWKVAVPGVVCEDGCSGDNCPKCDASKKEVFEKDCQVLTNPHGPFAVCHNVIDPASYYRDCVYDVCMAGGDRAVLCHSIGAYMMDCQTFGVTIPSWRTPNFCPLSCSANSHYQICAETCGTPCPGLIGQSVLMDDCQQLCTCTLAGHFHCMDTKCGIAESCEIQNGLQGCFPKQCVQTGGSFTLFNGVTGAVKPTMAAYTLVEYCNSSASEEWFRVVAKLQTCSLTASQSVSTVYVFCSDMMVAITDKLETWVNGRKVTLPAQPRKDLSVDVSGNSIHVEKKAAFRLSYSGSLGVTVTVSNGVAGIVCGACGPLSAGGILEVSEETMQEYLAPFIAPDFPTW
ncbi:hypothetical protein CRUP_002159 [Coryphaenoides rupestris]|nr:hypothetical protein CRUP_002159 [Coryphaenoides rupestris]